MGINEKGKRRNILEIIYDTISEWLFGKNGGFKI